MIAVSLEMSDEPLFRPSRMFGNVAFYFAEAEVEMLSQLQKELAENSALRREIQVSLIAGDRYVPLSIDPLCEYEP